MNDPVLVARLRALWDDLDFVSDRLRKSAWPSDQTATRAEMLVDSLWIGLEMTLGKEIELQKRAMERIERDVTQPTINDPAVLAAAWTRYAKVFQESQSVLRECLEIIGSLAIRNQDLDKRIWYVADQLIRECLVLSTGNQHYYLLVHGMEDTFIKTRSRILRLRFPEWTIWDLPLAAHELGHVIISENLELEKNKSEDRRILEPFVQNLRDSLVGLDPEWNVQNQAGGKKAEETERWAEDRVHEFLADAFATYTMGPAYACSAILLRLNPSLGASDGRPSDAQRAHVILSMLAWANTLWPLAPPYREVIEELQGYWNETLKRVNPHGKLTSEYEDWLKQLAEAFGKDAGPNSLRRSALYPSKEEREGWLRAQNWALEWMAQLQSNNNFNEPNTSSENLRDVLNAAWFCRLQIIKTMRQGDINQQIRSLKDLQEVGQKLCNTIMVSKDRGPTQQQIPVPSAGGRS